MKPEALQISATMSNVCDEETNVIDDKKEAKVAEIAASSVSGKGVEF